MMISVIARRGATILGGRSRLLDGLLGSWDRSDNEFEV